MSEGTGKVTYDLPKGPTTITRPWCHGAGVVPKK